MADGIPGSGVTHFFVAEIRTSRSSDSEKWERERERKRREGKERERKKERLTQRVSGQWGRSVQRARGATSVAVKESGARERKNGACE